MKTKTLNTVIESRCWKVAIVLTVAFSLLIRDIHSVKAAESAPRGKVALSLKADNKQPHGGPVVVEVTMTNLGSEDIHWWCGGPDRFPQGSQFKIEVAYLYDDTRFMESASNGQYSEGSGIYRHLKPGESMNVPLAIVIHEPDNTKLRPGQKAYGGVVRIHVSAIEWETDAPAETLVYLSGDKEVVDQRRTSVLKAIANDGPPFWLHMAQTYADDVVLDTMLKLAAIEVDPISKNALRALAWQLKLPESTGKDLAVMVRGLMVKKKPISPHSSSGDLLTAALKTQSEDARIAVLDYLKASKDGETSRALFDYLSWSPGALEWYKRVQQAIIEHQRMKPTASETSRDADRALGVLKSKIEHGD